MYKILIVEDDEAIAGLIAMRLRKAGYTCETISDGCRAADAMEHYHYDLGIFDIMLPGLDGYELLQYAKLLHLPVIFLTARDAVSEKIKGLRQGADDYMTKPFDLTELQARVENVLRRCYGNKSEYRVGNLVVDAVSRTVLRDGEPISLTKKEFDLLVLFLEHPNAALYRETIYERVWDNPYMGDSRTVDLHVQRLRRKTGLTEEIVSVYKVGYRLLWRET